MSLRGGKTTFIIAGVIVFITGIIIGSFLVLRSATSQGEIYSITNPQSGTTQNLLEDLRSIQELPPEQFKDSQQENLTKDFLETIAREGNRLGLDPTDYTNEEFLTNTILPFFQKNQIIIFPEILDYEVNIVPTFNPDDYLEKMRTHIFVLAGAWQKIIQINPDTIDNPETKEMFAAILELLDENDEQTRIQAVPENYIQFHKKTIQLSSAMITVIKNGILKNGGDPLKGMLAIALIEDIGSLGQVIIAEFSQIKDKIKQK